MSAIEPRIWSAKEFKKESSPSNPVKRHRGTQLQLIDQTLVRLDELIHEGAEARRKELVISQLMMACKNWLTDKGTKTSSTAKERKIAVEALGEQAFQWIKWRKFHERKANPGNAAVEKRAMRPGYRVERDMYVASGKARNPISGSYIHAAMETMGTFRTRTFATLTPADFQSLDNALVGEVRQPDPMGDPGSMAKTKVPQMVLFLKKQDRIKHLMIVQNGLLYEGFEKPLHTGGGGFIVAYVIDEYGNLYCSTETFDRNYSFNHSTFNAGKDVICAGTLSADQGSLRLLTNLSGHYKPTRVNLHNAVQFVANGGVNIAQARVWVNEPDPARAGKMIQYEYSHAQTFLANRDAVPDQTFPEP